MKTNCLNGACKREVVIDDKLCGIVITLYTNLTLEIDGYLFTADQLQKSPYSKMKSFVVSKVGDSIVFVSNLLSFWVRLDEAGDVKVGVSSKLHFGVDGLCGFYNGFQFDDRRLPNGTIVMSTADFADSWMHPNATQEKCIPPACTEELHAKAVQLCQAARDSTFAACGKSINVDQFVSRCSETACACLEQAKTPAQADACKCSLLQSFVTECYAADASVHLDTWRSKFDCVASCPPPLMHQDCYQRRCEPSCDTLNDSDCPFLPGTCFTGCYCPPGTVRKGEKCVPVHECKNCICDGFGRSQYITYDRKNFTFDGNCTYLLSRDILVPDQHTFQVFVTLGKCSKLSKEESCAQSLHVLYGPHVVHLQKGNSSIVTLLDGIAANALPFKSSWINVEEDNGKGLLLNFVDSQVEISAMFDDLAFSIRVPSIKYRSKLEGLCGDCNGDAQNDLQPNPKHADKAKSNKLEEIVQTWLSDEPALEQEFGCVSDEKSIENCLPLPPDDDPCTQMLAKETFGHCHFVVDPGMYVSLCQRDMCKSGPSQKGACTHLAAYVRECSRNGICVDWKKGACDDREECPAGMEWQACGCPKTCDTIKDEPIFVNVTCIEPVEGCYCRDGQVLINGKCLPEKSCSPCDDQGHFAGDTWHPDKCTVCECSASGKTDCVKKQCSAGGEICALGFKQVTVASEGECCPQHKCVPDEKKCEDAPVPNCSENQYVKMVSDAMNCSKFVCDCKPVAECKPQVLRALLAGEDLVQETSGCCPKQKIVCDKSKCPEKPTNCEHEFYELVPDEATSKSECCPKFKCVPPKNVCIVEIGGEKKLKSVGEVWSTEDVCVHQKCAYGPGGETVAVPEKHPCPEFTCSLGSKMVLEPGKCCGECVQSACVVNGTLHLPSSTWSSKDNCTKFECTLHGKQLVVVSAQPTCPDVSNCPDDLKYLEDCCLRCKQKAEPLSEYILSILSPGVYNSGNSLEHFCRRKLPAHFAER